MYLCSPENPLHPQFPPIGLSGQSQSMSNLPLIVLRIVLFLVASALGLFFIKTQTTIAHTPGVQTLVFAGMLGIAAMAVGLDLLIREKQLATISAVYFGLIVGMFLTFVAGLVISPFLDVFIGSGPDREVRSVHVAVQMVLGLVLCYACISLLLQTRNDFRFIIPYVEFAKEVKELHPYVLDTSVVIDGRIADIMETSLIDNPLVIPRFVISELQGIADSSDRLRRTRGRRGLDILNQLRVDESVDLQIFDRELPEFAGQPVDMKIVLLAKHLDGKAVTNDYNLNKVARLHGVTVINLNDLANALKPVFLPGEHVNVHIVKAGEESGQGVAYLDDGTMVVVEAGRDHINKDVTIVVTSVLQKSAGRMIFGRFEKVAAND